MTSRWHLKHKIHGNKPWSVQTEALRRSEGKDRYAYFLEQGLGKTPLSINDIVTYHKAGNIDFAVVLVPMSFKMDWVLSPEEWGRPEISSYWYPKHTVQDMYAESSTKHPSMFVANYEILRSKNSDDLFEFIEEYRVMLILDESGVIGNYNSQTTKNVIRLAKFATMVRELNGTPIFQNVLNYYGQLKVLKELNGVNPIAFRNRYVTMGGFMGKQIMIGEDNIQNKDELYSILKKCSFRALKRDWRKGLPPQIFKSIHLEMTRKQEFHYEEMMEEFYTEISEDLHVSAEIILTKMEKLRQISSCLAMQDGEYEFFESANRNPKLQAVLDILESGPNKAIVVHKYKPSGELLLATLYSKGYSPSYIRGGMKPDQIIENKKRFNEDSNCRVMVCQEHASFRGHTLLGGKNEDRCTVMIFFENDFSYYQRSQIQDRNHRGDQDQDCIYYDLVTSPMDKIVLKALLDKKDMADAVDEIVKAVRYAHG